MCASLMAVLSACKQRQEKHYEKDGECERLFNHFVTIFKGSAEDKGMLQCEAEMQPKQATILGSLQRRW